MSGSSWRRLNTELYCWAGWRENPWPLLSAWGRLLPRDAVFAGATAAWLWGIPADAVDPVEIIVPAESGVRSRRGLQVRRCGVPPDEICDIRGLRATTVNRVLLDLCARWPVVEALTALDAAARSGLVDGTALLKYADQVRGRPGAARLRLAAAHMAPAESPMETRLRWLLVNAGLPRPGVQVDLHDGEGRFVGRADLFYPRAGLVVEYDGANHRDRLVEDNRRQNLILNAGYRLLRFTAPDLERPERLVAQVKHALAEADLWRQTSPIGDRIGASGVKRAESSASVADFARPRPARRPG